MLKKKYKKKKSKKKKKKKKQGLWSMPLAVCYVDSAYYQ